MLYFFGISVLRNPGIPYYSRKSLQNYDFFLKPPNFSKEKCDFYSFCYVRSTKKVCRFCERHTENVFYQRAEARIVITRYQSRY